MPLVVHGHFYQPPRENPWTEEVAREPTAAPYHDWNERIASECYRPNAFARVVDDRGRVVSIVNNFAHLSFDVGPTLSSWLVERQPQTWKRIAGADAASGGGMAQAYFHVILPLAPERDVRTLVRWGLAEFETRYGHRPPGMWLPETAVNDEVLAVLIDEGVAFTILAPGQAAAVREVASGSRGAPGQWTDVTDGSIDTTRPYRWLHPAGDGRGIDLLFYDGPLSHAIAFEMAQLSSEALVRRTVEAGSRRSDSLVLVAADGETFGHHHVYGDRLLAYALAVEAPRQQVKVTTAAEHLRRVRPAHEVRVRESAWSCVHGVGRWRDDCGCETGGQPDWNQRWRAPLRAALDVVRAAADEAFARRAPRVLADPEAARDGYVRVLLGTVDRDSFLDEHRVPSAGRGGVDGEPAVDADVEALTLLELQRHALAMYTSCGWFFNDLAGIETLQVLRYAGRTLDLLTELGERPPRDEFLDVLATARSNVASEGDGRQVWMRHVEPARVDAARVVAHVALLDLLQRRFAGAKVAVFSVDVGHHLHAERGSVALCAGELLVTHGRTGRGTRYAYAALRLGDVEVLGASQEVEEAGSRTAALEELDEAFERGTPVTVLLRMISERLGPQEFGLPAALPDTAEQIFEGAAASLTDRFIRAYEQLLDDHRAMLVALNAAGYPLPPVLRAPAELALARRLENDLAAPGGSLDSRDYAAAVATARAARANGVVLASPQAAHTVGRLLAAAAERAAADAAFASRALELAGVLAELGLQPPLDRAQEIVYDALAAAPRREPALVALAERLGLAVDLLP